MMHNARRLRAPRLTVSTPRARAVMADIEQL
jgi:hypothetical protein